MTKYNYLLSILFLSSHLLFSQGSGINLNTVEATNGYLLFETSFDSHLVNNCGEIVHTWPGAAGSNLHTKLLPNGNLVYLQNGYITELDWNNNGVNSTKPSDPNLMLVYEVIVMPEGNYLCLGRRAFSDFAGLGYDIPGTFPQVVDVVVEVDRSSGNIVWEWNISDHVIQERDPNANNFGILSDHPELLSMDHISTFDWESYESFMINGMDYNPELDQIALSVRKMSEVVIIDHSTTTQEAAGSTGGNMGKGGDILYRWGNPQNYNRGSGSDRVLYYQHNPNWIKFGEHKGKLICYNNGLNNPNVDFLDRYSSAPIFDPLKDGNGNYVISPGQPFLPLNPTVAYDRVNTNTFFYSGYTSAAKVLPNGNILITEGNTGRCFEVDKDTGDLLWQYDVDEGPGYLFRSEKYPLDFPAFSGKDLTPNGTVENPPNSYDCTLIVGTDDVEPSDLGFKFLPIFNSIRINKNLEPLKYRIITSDGRSIQKGMISSEISLQNCPPGVYFCTFYLEGYKPITHTFTKSI